MGGTLDYVIAIGCLVVGIMLLTGHGAVFMKGGNERLRKEKYDTKKMERATGIAFVLIGIVSFVDIYTTGMAAKIGYIVVLFLVFVPLIYYLKVKCKKK